jgi:sigma-B regulation protein RsbU (phosphoserine phosphatase)
LIVNHVPSPRVHYNIGSEVQPPMLPWKMSWLVEDRTRLFVMYRNYVFLVPLFAVVLFYEAAHIAVAIRNFQPGHITITRPFDNAARRVTTTPGPVGAAGLHTGDEILSINGVDFKGDLVLFEQLNAARDGRPFVVRARHGSDAPRRIVIPPGSLHSGPLGGGEIAIESALILLLTACVLVGIYVAAVRPYDLRAIIVFFLMVSTSQVISLVAWYQFPRSLWVFVLTLRTIAQATWGIWLVLFPLYFPQRFSWDVRRPFLKWILLVPVIGWTLVLAVDAMLSYWDFQLLPSIQNPDQDGRLFLTACITFFFGALAFKIHSSPGADAKRRLRVLMAGAISGLTPLGLFVAYEVVTKSQVPMTVIFVLCFLFFLFPLTLAYAVVAERAMNLRMVIRQGVRYALAKGGVHILFGLIVASLMWSLSNAVFGSRMPTDFKITVFILIAIAAMRILRGVKTRMHVALDRRFFREAYNAQLVLEELSETLMSLVREQELLDTVSRRVAETFHVSSVMVLIQRDGNFTPACWLGSEPEGPVTLTAGSKTITVIENSKDPARVYFDRRDSWVHQLPEEELVTLKSIHAQLLLPLGAKNKLLGILSLGPKLSEEPYSPSDVQLLRSVSAQTGMALENGRLASAFAEEVAQRERLNREIEIAREVQQRLFPQHTQMIAGIDYCGACRPALLVGGDYYDFLNLSNADLGIAIGDVSGKGIAAALLMASLQASLRGQAMTNQGDLARLMMNINQLIYDATPENRYATFFYGQYNRDRHILRYVNAGHNPPIILRRTSDGATHVIRLETGGMVVGLLPNTPYQEGSLLLEPGDLFVGFTDGISEAMNAAEEEWGEERLIPAIAANRDCRADDLIPTLLTEADKFVAGAPQHDDMTLIVMKMAA